VDRKSQLMGAFGMTHILRPARFGGVEPVYVNKANGGVYTGSTITFDLRTWGIEAGDFLLCLAATQGSGDMESNSGNSMVTIKGGFHHSFCRRLLCDGTETYWRTYIAVTKPNCVVLMHIKNCGSVQVTSLNNSYNPPAQAMSGDSLAYAAVTVGRYGDPFNNTPSGYSSVKNLAGSGGYSSTALALVKKDSAPNATENPGPIYGNSNTVAVAYTIEFTQAA